MVNNKHRRNSKVEPPPLDEEWWSAILAEEDGGQTVTIPSSHQVTNEKNVPCQKVMNWQRARQLYQDDAITRLKVSGFNLGGLLVDNDDLQGFVPVSHLVDTCHSCSETEREKHLASYLGRCLMLKVIECDPERGRVVFSERAALAEPGSRTQLFVSLQPGMRIIGTVTNITDFGVFVDLGGVEGLVHVSELSWGRVRHPAEFVQLGETTEVYVINVDQSRNRVALSLKRLHPNPWESATSRYYPGQIVEARITSILPFGAFARLEEGLDGLIHTSQMGSKTNPEMPNEFLSEGQSVRVRVLQVDTIKQRLGLSLLLDE